LDPSRLEFFRERSKQLSSELLTISKNPAAEVDDLGHSRDAIDSIYQQAIKVKAIAASLP